MTSSIISTYAMQAFCVIVGTAAATLFLFACAMHRPLLAAVNILLLGANIALFVIQGMIRRTISRELS